MPYKISTPPMYPSCREVAEKVVHCATGSAQHFENNIWGKGGTYFLLLLYSTKEIPIKF